MTIRSKYIEILLILLGMNLILISQTRNLLIFLFFPLFIIYARRGVGVLFNKFLLLIFLGSVLLSLFYDNTYIIDNSERFFIYNDVINLNNQESTSFNYKNAPTKLKPFLWSLHETNNVFDLFFGHGLSFKEYSGRKHYHSGLGYLYGSMGLIGVALLFIIFLRIQYFYKKFINYKNSDLNSILIELILSFYITLAIISPFTGLLIQEFSLFHNGLLLSILEVCRRNIVNKNYIYHI